MHTDAGTPLVHIVAKFRRRGKETKVSVYETGPHCLSTVAQFREAGAEAIWMFAPFSSIPHWNWWREDWTRAGRKRAA